MSKQSHATTNAYNTHTHTRPFNGPFSGTIRVSRYQKGKTIWILLKQETVSGSGISRATCKSAPRSRHITTPAPHHSVFYRLDAPPTTQPRVSKQSHAATHAYNTIRTLSLNSYTPANYGVFKKSSPSSCICYHLSDSKLILIWQKRRQSPSERKNTYLLNVIMY